MKNANIFYFITIIGMVACTDSYIDEINPVDQGSDEVAPTVMINFPVEGTLIRVSEDVTSINIMFEATDDIEIQTITVNLNGNEIASFDAFRDYRRAIVEYPYDNLTNGEHTLTVTATDLSGKSTDNSVNFEKVPPYQPLYEAEVFYLPSDGDYMELISISNGTVIGSPGFAGQGVQGGNAYAGAAESYLTFPTTGLLGEEFSAVFWYKINPDPARAGILVISPPDPNNPDAMNNRTKGFRFFREGSASNQTFKLNVGNGTAETWFDGGAEASVDPTITSDWVHLAFTITGSSCAVYINGEVVSEGEFEGISWADCDILSIGSGAPRFTEWGHLSDRSFLDELRIFNKALSQEEIRNIINAEQP